MTKNADLIANKNNNHPLLPEKYTELFCWLENHMP